MFKTRRALSPIDGFGLVALDDIPQGIVTRRYAGVFDHTVTPQGINNLPDALFPLMRGGRV